jgi:hypothetical protein
VSAVRIVQVACIATPSTGIFIYGARFIFRISQVAAEAKVPQVLVGRAVTDIRYPEVSFRGWQFVENKSIH